MAAQCADKIRVFHFLIDIADKRAPRHVRGCNLVQRFLHLLPGLLVEYCYDAIQPRTAERLFDVAVVVMSRVEREQAVPVVILVFGNQPASRVVQRNTHGDRSILLGRSRDILDRIIDDAPVRHFIKVADAVADEALNYENIALRFQFFIVGQIGFEQLIPFFIADVNRRSVHNLPDGKMLERIVDRIAVVDGPEDKRPKSGQHVRYGILAARLRHSSRNLVVLGVERGRTFALGSFNGYLRRIGKLFVYFRVLQEYRLFIEQEIFDLPQ